MKHLKTTLLACALLFSVNTLMAQEKYDYAVIRFQDYDTKLYITINEEVEAVEIPKEVFKDKLKSFSPVPALKQVNRLEDEGWTLYDNTVSALGTTSQLTYVFFLRRKEQ